MQAFTSHHGRVAPLDRANVDTDAIIPQQFLKSIHRTGFGPNLFDTWRYHDRGEPGMDPASRQPDPDFVLNQAAFADASILLARENFGCGSSREHAPWALVQYGFRALIAPSYADIFLGNCFKNGLLPIALTTTQVDQLFARVTDTPGMALTIDLPAQTVQAPGLAPWHFEIAPFHKQCLLRGDDDIQRTLHHTDTIRRFEAARLKAMPWLDAHAR